MSIACVGWTLCVLSRMNGYVFVSMALLELCNMHSMGGRVGEGRECYQTWEHTLGY